MYITTIGAGRSFTTPVDHAADFLASLGNHQRKRLIAEAHNRVRSNLGLTRIVPRVLVSVSSRPRRFWGDYHSKLREALRSIHGEMVDRSEESAQW